MLVTPVMGLTLPERSGESVAQMLSGPECKDLLAVLEGSAYWLPTFLALYTGMRPGEVLGLSWEDVDLAEGTLSVRHTMSIRRGALHLGPPKTRTSVRTVAVPPEVVQVLREVKQPANYSWSRRRTRGEVGEYTAAEPIDFRQVCARPDGRILTDNCWRTGFLSILRRECLREVRLHDLRHTHASLLLLGNVPIHVVSKRLGHSNIQTTINQYGHLLPSSDPEAAARFADIIRMES